MFKIFFAGISVELMAVNAMSVTSDSMLSQCFAVWYVKTEGAAA